MNVLAYYLRPQDILLDVEAPSKPALIDAVALHMEQVHSLPRDSIFLGLNRREQLASTGLGQGFAIPHCRVRGLDRILAAYLRLKSPIPFDAPDGEPVTDILVLLVPKQAAEEHLAVLADATRMFSSPRFREYLRQCSEPRSVRQLFEGWPRPSDARRVVQHLRFQRFLNNRAPNFYNFLMRGRLGFIPSQWKETS